MSLRSSELISSIGRLRALHVQAAGGVLLLGPQQVVRLLADLRAAGPRAGAGDRVADAHRRGLRADDRREGQRHRRGGEGADHGPAREARRSGCGEGSSESPWCRGERAGSRGRLRPGLSACRAAPRLPAHAVALVDLCTPAPGFPGGVAWPRRRGSRRAARHRRQHDEHRPGRAGGARRLLGRLDQPPVLRPEVRPVRRHRLRRPDCRYAGAGSRPTGTGDALGSSPARPDREDRRAPASLRPASARSGREACHARPVDRRRRVRQPDVADLGAPAHLSSSCRPRLDERSASPALIARSRAAGIARLARDSVGLREHRPARSEAAAPASARERRPARLDLGHAPLTQLAGISSGTRSRRRRRSTRPLVDTGRHGRLDRAVGARER